MTGRSFQRLLPASMVPHRLVRLAGRRRSRERRELLICVFGSGKTLVLYAPLPSLPSPMPTIERNSYVRSSVQMALNLQHCKMWHRPPRWPEKAEPEMASTATFTCLCGIQKKLSNHWILATQTKHGVKFVPWDWNLARGEDVIVLCGEGCAAALLSRALGQWKQASIDSQTGRTREVASVAA